MFSKLEKIQDTAANKLLGYMSIALVLLLPMSFLRIIETGFHPVMILHMVISLISWIFYFGKSSIRVVFKYIWIVSFFILVAVGAVFKNDSIFYGMACFLISAVVGSIYFDKLIIAGVMVFASAFILTYIIYQDGFYIEALFQSLATPILMYIAIWVTYYLRNELMLYIQHALKVSEEKSNFVSYMSHEIRTPLAAILGYSQILQLNEELSDEGKENVGYIISAGNLLLSLVNDTLDLSKIECGKVDLEVTRVELPPLIDECFKIIHPMAKGNDISLLKSTPEICVVLADNKRLKQVIINLLSNAVKYNRPNGQVRLEVYTSKDNDGFFRIDVSDTGYGIQENLQDKIFLPFSRVHIKNTKIEGSGMGLSITKSLVELMGGGINFYSKPGIGSTFWFELPKSLDDSEINSDNI